MEIIKGRIYKHFKGDYYLVEDIVNPSFITRKQQEIVGLSNVAYVDVGWVEKNADFFIILLVVDGEKVIRIRFN